MPSESSAESSPKKNSTLSPQEVQFVTISGILAVLLGIMYNIH